MGADDEAMMDGTNLTQVSRRRPSPIPDSGDSLCKDSQVLQLKHVDPMWIVRHA